MVDVCDDLAILILHGRAHHHEDHRAAAPGLFVNLLDVGAERDLVAGTNVVQLGTDTYAVFSNVDIVLVNVPKGVQVLPGSNNSYPVN